MDTNTIIRLLTGASLGGLLFTVGIRLTWPQVTGAMRQRSLWLLLPANFLLVPMLTYAIVRCLHVPTPIAIGMMLLSASPFAPVVPIFARFSRADLPLAAGLTALFPFASAFLTPVICEAGLRALGGDQALHFSALLILLVLLATITAPMSVGVLLRHFLPRVAHAILRPIEVLSEAAGASSLAFVTVVEFHSILETGAMNLLAMAILYEMSLWLGFSIPSPNRSVRRVLALGTSNRNIALALLVAVQSFPGTPILGAVVANGLLLIGLGLIHVGWWRFADCRDRSGCS